MRKLLILIGLAVASLASYQFAGGFSDWQSDTQTETAFAQHRDLFVITEAQGQLVSQKQAIKCKVKGAENRIIDLVEHGAQVQEGDLLVHIDESAIDQQISLKQIEINSLSKQVSQLKYEFDITENTTQGAISTAEHKLEIARLTLEKYVKSDFRIQKLEIEAEVAEASANLEKSRQQADLTRQLVAKGYRTSKQYANMLEQVRNAESTLTQKTESLRAVTDFEFQQKKHELTTKVDDAQNALNILQADADTQLVNIKNQLEAAKTKLAATEFDLKDLVEQKQSCKIYASQAGIVARCEKMANILIAKHDRIVYDQDLIYFVDKSKLAVKFEVPSSVGQKMEMGDIIALNVFGIHDHQFTATVTGINSDDSDECHANMDSIPSEYSLHPGMKAEVQVLTGRHENVLTVPLISITRLEQELVVFIESDGKLEKRKVVLSAYNNHFAAISSGLEPGDEVVLDAKTFAKSLEMTAETSTEATGD